MVKNSARKKAVRAFAAATGQPYTAAARQTARRHRHSGVSAYEVHTELTAALQKAGWPVEIEDFPENVEYRSYPGPARVTVGRANQVTSFGGADDPDPDDDTVLDMSRPPQVEMAAPLTAAGYEICAEFSGDRPTSELVNGLHTMLAQGRATAVARTVNNAACAVCGDRYPPAHLLAAAGDDRLRVCPACAFDGDVLLGGEDATAYLTYQLDQLRADDLAIPAGWAGPAALLACVAPNDFGERLHQQWRDAGTLHIPSPFWSDPGLLWIWLPPEDQRPAPLTAFGPGARLDAIVAALDDALPGLRQQVRTEQAENWREAGSLDDEDEPTPDMFVEKVWSAAVAYAVSFSCQAVERPLDRPPLQHLLGSFDTLQDHLTLIGSDLNFDDIESTLGVGIDTITAALWPSMQR